MLCVLVFYVVLNKPKHFIMKTPIQDLITQVEEWMLYDKYVQDNPLDYEEYMVMHANQMIKVKGKFIDICNSLLEKEEYTMGLLLNFILKRYSTDLDTSLRGYCFIDANGEEVTISEILEHFYNETFNTKER